MEFISSICQFDTNLLLSINGIHNSYFDKFMYAFTQIFVWIPFYVTVIYALIKQRKKDALWLIAALIICVALSDQLSSGLIKNTVQRLRPTNDPSVQGLLHIVNNYRGGLYGFVSSHAANTVSFALLSSLFFRKREYTIAVFVWAIMNCYTRLYLGVHYPFDILGGILAGIMVATICYLLLRKFKPNLLLNKTGNDTSVRLPFYTLLITLACIMIYAI